MATRSRSLSIVFWSCITSVLRFGSFGHSFMEWPGSLQHLHFLYLLICLYWALMSSSSRSSLMTCFWNLQPRASLFYLPQHHHISPEYSDRCVRHDQLKFSDSTKSSPQNLQLNFSSLSIKKRFDMSFYVFRFSLMYSRSSYLHCVSVR